MNKLTQFFGDVRRDFHLTPEMIVELERVTGAGIGGLSRRIFSGDFHRHEIVSTVRLALIGGGETPENAAALIAAYVDPRPLMEAFTLAVSILEMTMLGPVQELANSRKRKPKNDRR